MWREIGALVLVLSLVAGLLLTVGTLRARKGGDQAIFVAGWTLILLSSLALVHNY
jgi:hypothetical protein